VRRIGKTAQIRSFATDLNRVRLNAIAKIVIASAATSGLVAVLLAANAAGRPSSRQIVVAATFCVLLIANWRWPLVMYREGQSEGVQLDEGFFVILTILVPGPLLVLGFAVATVAGQLVRRRPLAKSLFNSGQFVTAAAAGSAVAHLISPSIGPHPAALGAVLAGVAVFVIVNNLFLVAILTATGTPWRSSLVDGWQIRVLMLAGSISVATTTALVAAAYPWSLALSVVPLLILRQVLSGHFQARHDRTRLTGLFEATLEANRSMGSGKVSDNILGSARTLLRCPDAELTSHPPGPDQLGATLGFDHDDMWLVVSGRDRQEPFDDADGKLLEALAAVGNAALTNASLYEEGRYQRKRLAAITSSLGEGVCALNPQGRITFLNRAAAEMLGTSPIPAEADLNTSLDSVALPLAPPFLQAPGLRAMQGGASVRSDDTTFQRADGTTLPVALTASPIQGDHGTTGAVVVFRDITERKAFEEQLARHAFSDALTGLANRRLFLDHLEHAVRRSPRSGETHAVIFADVDRFKVVNDSLGHHVGDQLLISIAERLRSSVRPGDVLARLGGDEFTILLEGVDGPGDAFAVALRVREALRAPIPLADGHDVVVTMSLGIALSSPTSTRDDLLRDADVAMYHAKTAGRSGGIEVFEPATMGARSAQRVELESDLRRALERDELEVYYQPVYSAAGHQIIGAEALVRWNHPTRGLLAPAEFITVAEETGLILPLGRAVLETACRQTQTWRDTFDALLSIAVNLSPRQFRQPDLMDQIEHVLHETGLDPRQLCLEITESMAMDDIDGTTAVLARLKQLGTRLAIDDFGTGYSSLGYLKQFPLDVVKIDRSFVDGLDLNAVDSAIIAAVVTLARSVGMTTVAEGVETLAQLKHLQTLGCDALQGYYLSRPLPAAALERLLAEGAAFIRARPGAA